MKMLFATIMSMLMFATFLFVLTDKRTDDEVKLDNGQITLGEFIARQEPKKKTKVVKKQDSTKPVVLTDAKGFPISTAKNTAKKNMTPAEKEAALFALYEEHR